VDAVNLGREAGLEISVRGGGHNVARKAVTDGGLMIDLALLKGMHVDPAARTARAQAGLRVKEYDRATAVFGLATPMGVVSSTGIAGLTLGGAGRSRHAGRLPPRARRLGHEALRRRGLPRGR
jgi:FAD/FMN-containing dehydrogenase